LTLLLFNYKFTEKSIATRLVEVIPSLNHNFTPCA